MNNVITDFSKITDSELDAVAQTIISNCTGNTNFNFTDNALINVTASQSDFHTKLGNVALGGPMAVTAKNESKVALLINLRVLCKQVNLQANGDLGKLQSSGSPLTKTPGNHDMPMPTGFVIKYNDISGSIDVSVDKPNVSDHGTLFAFTLATNAANDINDWKILHANGHSLTINGLTAGQTYQFSAAYKGRDEAMLIWAPTISKMIV